MLLLLLACTRTPTEEPGCAALTDLARDQCLYDTIGAMSDSSPADLLEHAGQIQDTVIREAALLGWVKEHGCDHPREAVLPLCTLIEGGLQGKCRRRIDAIHLCR